MKNPILVTGAHRSGTTWVGKILSLSKDIGYIQEPFNYNYRPGLSLKKFDYWFPYINEEMGANYLTSIQRTMDYEYNTMHHIKNLENFYDLLRLGRDWIKFNKFRLMKLRPLIKDPNAFFMADWLQKKFNTNVVFTIRHPASFISSLMKLEWSHDFRHFKNQPNLMREKLVDFSEEINEAIKCENYRIIDQGILLWKILYSYLYNLSKENENIILLKNEKLSLNPVEEFHLLFDKLSLNYTRRIQDIILKNSSQNSDNPFSISRNSIENVQIWENRLSENDINYIKHKLDGYWQKFYSPKDW